MNSWVSLLFLLIQRINAEPFNSPSEIPSEPPILPTETPFQKKYITSPSVESNTANDCDLRRTTEAHWTGQEKPEGLTFEERRKIRQTPVTEREYSSRGNGWVRRNCFGKIVDFSI